MTNAVERQLNDPTICQVCGMQLSDPKDTERIAVLNGIIETQQAIIDDLRGLIDAKVTPGYELLAGTIAKRDAEIERLRTALAETLQGYLDTEYYDQEIVDRAKAALE